MSGKTSQLVRRTLILVAIAEIVLAVLGVYGYIATLPLGQSVSTTSEQPVTLTGVGATLAYPLLSAIATKYGENHPGTRINYQPIGSGTGVVQFLHRTIDFGATYPPMTQDERNRSPSLPLHIPESISAVVVAYNVPGVPTGLQLNGTVIADIFLGRITSWADPAITQSNPRLVLPDHVINTAHMAEAEGTTFVFTSYLSLVSPTFEQQLGKGTSVAWTIGVSVLTDTGVAALIASSPYSIGYVELAYAIQTKLTYASILNAAGKYIAPSTDSARAAEEQLRVSLPKGGEDWADVNLLNEAGDNAYPLVTFTYLIVYQELSTVPLMDLAKAKALVDFLWYLDHDGQSLVAPLGYVALSPNVVSINEDSIKSITFHGQIQYP